MCGDVLKAPYLFVVNEFRIIILVKVSRIFQVLSGKKNADSRRGGWWLACCDEEKRTILGYFFSVQKVNSLFRESIS